MKKLEKIIETIIFILTSLMVIITFSQVISRYIFDSSIQWAEEFARFSMVWLTFLGAALVVKERGHTRIDFFVRKLFRNKFKYVNVLLNLIISIFLIALTAYSVPIIKAALKDVTPGLGIPYGYVFFALPFGAILMIIYLIQDGIKWLKAGGEN